MSGLNGVTSPHSCTWIFRTLPALHGDNFLDIIMQIIFLLQSLWKGRNKLLYQGKSQMQEVEMRTITHRHNFDKVITGAGVQVHSQTELPHTTSSPKYRT